MNISYFINDDFWIMAIRIIIAALLGGIIGFERELNNHDAGLRTHILVAVGSCLMMLLSLFGFSPYLNDHENIRFDPARIPSYVISGIGFLGAGTIMVHGVTIRGLTTAASIWTVAGLGLIIGAGMYPAAILTTIVILLSLVFLNRIESVVTRKRNNKFVRLKIRNEVKITEILSIFERMDISVRKIRVERESAEERDVVIELDAEQSLYNSKILDELMNLKNVGVEFEHH
ncbi:MgtC/SapB family protein [Bacillaceae bacterium S4-13-58]